eukprot:4637520-Lingulodinium_polyedra.AAC.1
MCYRCGEAGHVTSQCPNVAQDNPDARKRRRDDTDGAVNFPGTMTKIPLGTPTIGPVTLTTSFGEKQHGQRASG